MVFNKEMIDLLQLLRKRFKEEQLGILQLSNPNVLDDMVTMATLSTCHITKDLAYAAIQLADLSLSRHDLDPPESHSLEDQDEKSAYRTYRGQKILVEDKPRRTSGEGSSGKVRMYRGQVVAS
ncbi:hypothetical protein [Hahella ganghwensis]|uniref:hypothetical protein n=1 Tax=Hahella ganghwensis TaxID=286420 RepID=UPI00036227C6|nr:hypothetical protein [Hahella ganghwensis]